MGLLRWLGPIIAQTVGINILVAFGLQISWTGRSRRDVPNPLAGPISPRGAPVRKGRSGFLQGVQQHLGLGWRDLSLFHHLENA